MIKENQVVSNGNAKWQNITSYGYDKNGNRLNRVEYKNVDSNKFNLGMIDVGSNSKGQGISIPIMEKRYILMMVLMS